MCSTYIPFSLMPEDLERIAKESGILVKGFLEYSVDNFGDIPKKSGAYILYRYNNKRYIGSSANVRLRTQIHMSSYADEIKHGKANHIQIFVTQGRSDAKKLERFLIIELDPELNFYSEIYGKVRIR
jgi:excinuclease UvrABC nuclease subunit